MKESVTGYKANSKDKNEKQLFIKGSDLTMINVPHKVGAQPVYPNGSYGIPTVMLPGVSHYSFPGAVGVIETKLPKAQTLGELKEQALQRDWNRQQATAWDPNNWNVDGVQPGPLDYDKKTGKYYESVYDPQTGQFSRREVKVEVKPMTIGLPSKKKVSKEDKAYAEASRENKRILTSQIAEDAWYAEHPEFIKDPVTGAPIRREAYELGSAEGFKEARIEEEKKKFVDDLNSDPLQQSLGKASLDNPVTNAAAERYANYKVNNVDPGRASDQLFRGYQAPTTQDFYRPNELSNTLRGAAGLGATAAGVAGLSAGLAYLPVLGEAAYAWGAANPFIQAAGSALSASPSWAPGLSIGNAINAGFITHGVSELPETYRAWDNAINNNGSYLDAAGQTLLNSIDFLGLGELKATGILDDIIKKSVQEAGMFNIDPTKAFIRAAKREGLLPLNADVQTLFDNPNLLKTAIQRNIKNNLTVGRRVTPSAGSGVAESSSGTITGLAKGDAAALARFTGDPVGEAFYMGTHIPRDAYGMRSGLQNLPYDLDALYFDAPGYFAKQSRITPNQYGDFTVTSRIPFNYSTDPKQMYAEYMRMLQETKGMSGGKGAKPGDIFGQLHGTGANESAIIGKPGQQVLEPVSVSTIADYNKPLAEFEELMALSKEDPEKFKAVFWEKVNSGQLARTKQELGLSEDATFLDPLYGIRDNPTLNDLRFALRADANNKQLALRVNTPIQKTNFSPLTTSFGNSAPVELTASQANRRLVTAQKQFDALSKRGYENLSPNELLDAFRLENEIKNLSTQVNKNTGTTAEAFSDAASGISGVGSKPTEQYKKMMRFFTMPDSKSKSGQQMLADFRKRIATPEGQRRLKALGITNPHIFEGLVIKEIQNELAYFNPNFGVEYMALHKDIPEAIAAKITRHEIEHAVQKAVGRLQIPDPLYPRLPWKAKPAGTTEIDDILGNLTFKGKPSSTFTPRLPSNEPIIFPSNQELFPSAQRNLDYFVHGSSGKEKSAFLGEVQQSMLEDKIIDDVYQNITPEKVEEAYNLYMKNESPDKYKLRLFDIIEPTKENFTYVSKGLNKMLGIASLIGIGIGVGAATQQKKKGGNVNKRNNKALDDYFTQAWASSRKSS